LEQSLELFKPAQETPTAVVQEAVVDTDCLEIELIGYLRHLCYGAVRTQYTPASLNRMASNWLEENKARLGPYENWALRADMIGRCVNAVLPPGLVEAGLMDVYCRRGDEIKAYNRGLAEMGDQREDMRWIVAAGGAACAGLSLATHVAGRPGAAAVLGVAGAAGVATYGWSKARDLYRRATAARWF